MTAYDPTIGIVQDPLMDVAREMFGIRDEQWRGFLAGFVDYVNLRDRDDYSHSEACAVLPIDSRRSDDYAALYRVILDQPELWW